MGCLTAAIYTAFLYDIDSSIENENVKVEVDTYNYSSIPEVNLFIDDLIEVQLDNFNLTPTTSTLYIAQTLDVQVSLVCSTSTGEYELLSVTEGNIITIDGQYIRVLRNGV